MRLADWFLQKLLDRLVPLFAGLFASRIETTVILEQADHLDALEERARRFEAEGKPELAAALRARAAKVTPENPAGSVLPAIHNLQADLPPLPDFGEPSSNGELPGANPPLDRRRLPRSVGKKGPGR